MSKHHVAVLVVMRIHARDPHHDAVAFKAQVTQYFPQARVVMAHNMHHIRLFVVRAYAANKTRKEAQVSKTEKIMYVEQLKLVTHIPKPAQARRLGFRLLLCRDSTLDDSSWQQRPYSCLHCHINISFELSLQFIEFWDCTVQLRGALGPRYVPLANVKTLIAQVALSRRFGAILGLADCSGSVAARAASSILRMAGSCSPL